MTERERLIKLIIASVDGCAEYWVSRIADYLLANGVRLPVTCGECVECYNEGNFGADGYCSEGKRRADNV